MRFCVIGILLLAQSSSSFMCPLQPRAAAPPSSRPGRVGCSATGDPTLAAGAPVDTPKTQQRTVSEVLDACLEACEAVTPLVKEVYKLVGEERTAAAAGGAGGSTANKGDGSLFTLADGLVQALFERLLRQIVAAVIAEEDSSSLYIEAPPYSVCGLTAPASLELLVKAASDRVDAIAVGLKAKTAKARGASSSSTPALLDLVAVIDPIDGTKEFGSGKGEQCTICVGVASGEGRAIGGVVYRPLDAPAPTWAMGCTAEGLAQSSLRASASRGGFLASAGRVSPFLTTLCAEMQLEMAPAGGAGNKMLLLLEGVGDAYVQDRGLSRWDTCAAEAVLEAHGGTMAQLHPFASRGQLVRYNYSPSVAGENSDFEPGLAALTRYNVAPSARALLADGARATEPTQVQPYANTLGLLALPASAGEGQLAACLDAVRRAAAVHPPEYD